MSYLYTILSVIILSTSVFAMERKEAADRKNNSYSSYNPRKEFYEQSIPRNKSVKDIPSYSKHTSDEKNKNRR